MSSNYGRVHTPETSGLEELAKTRGQVDHHKVLKEAEDLLIANASTSVPNINAYEVMVSLQHVQATRARLRTYVFPGSGLEHGIIGTPYRTEITLEPGQSDPYLLYPEAGLIEKNLGILPHKPLERIQNIIVRSVERKADKDGGEVFADLNDLPADTPKMQVEEQIGAKIAKDPRQLHRLLPEDREKLTRYLLNLPAGIFRTAAGKPFLEQILEQRMKFTRTLGGLMLEDHLPKLEKLGIEDISPYLEGSTLADLAEMLGPDFKRKVAFTFCCAECGINSKERVNHFVLFDGSMYQNMGHIKTTKPAEQIRGCKMLSDGNGGQHSLTREKILHMPLNLLSRAGFMLSGAGIYAAISRAVAEPDMAMSIVNYKPARGTVEAAARLWPGPMMVSPKVNIYREGRDASYWELEEYLQAAPGNAGKFMDYVRSIPEVSDGRIHDLNI
jgi:hypothetical protein